LYLLLLMVANMYKHMGKVVIKILQGSAVTQTVLGGLTIYLLVANLKFPTVYMCQKLWKLAGSRQSYCKNYLAYFFWPTLYIPPLTGKPRPASVYNSKWRTDRQWH